MIKLRSISNKRYLVVLAVFVAAVSLQAFEPKSVSADKYDDQIKALQQQLDSYNAQAAELANQAQTLQSTVSSLRAEANAIQAQIDISQAKYNKLVADIAATEVRIKEDQDALGTTLADLYIDDQTTLIELLASSANLSDYLDKQEYRTAIKENLSASIDEIKILQTQLEKDKKDVERVLKDQNIAKDNLVAKQQEQQKLLNDTKGQEAAFQGLIGDSRAEIQKVREAQAAYFASLASSNSKNISAGDPNKGGYPTYLANAPQDSRVDNWGMYNRECVSYTAWKVYQSYKNMPYWGGRGNAWQWAFSGWKDGRGRKVFCNSGNWHTSNAESYGIPSGSTPKVGSVAVADATPNNPYGHVAWVEGISGSTIRISQYNWYVASLGGWGVYTEMTVNSSIFQRYIYFGEW